MSVITEIGQTIINGVVLGSIISVAAVGFTLSYGITRFINFAYGEYITIGPFVALVFAGVGLSLPLQVLIAVCFSAILAVIISRGLFLPIKHKGPLSLLITSIGVAFILRNALIAIFGSSPQQLEIPLIQSWVFYGLRINPISLVLMTVAIASMVAVHVLLQQTMLGKKMRAMSGNRELAQIAGINVAAVHRITWVISGTLAGIAGILISIRFAPFNPLLGWNVLLVVFAATILGGIGKPYGAMIGSFIIGLVMSTGSRFFASEYSFAYAFLVLVIVLLLFPRGIAGGEI